MTSAYALQLRDVEKRFGMTHVIRGVSLDIARGERHAIIGPNGAGKSTLFNLISGRFVPTRGSIRLNGEEIAGRHAVRDQPARPRAKLPGHEYLSAPVGVREPPLQRLVVARIPVLLLAQRRHAARRRANWRDAVLEQIGLAARRDVAAGVLTYAEQRALEIGITIAGGAERYPARRADRRHEPRARPITPSR